jgi:hypothetical protein
VLRWFILSWRDGFFACACSFGLPAAVGFSCAVCLRGAFCLFAYGFGLSLNC